MKRCQRGSAVAQSAFGRDRVVVTSGVLLEVGVAFGVGSRDDMALMRHFWGASGTGREGFGSKWSLMNVFGR